MEVLKSDGIDEKSVLVSEKRQGYRKSLIMSGLAGKSFVNTEVCDQGLAVIFLTSITSWLTYFAKQMYFQPENEVAL